MKKLIALLLAVMIVSCLCACGEGVADISGTYPAISCVIDGKEYSCDGEYVKLNADGTGTVMFVNLELDIDWTLDGSSFSFTDSDGDKFTGTYADGVLTGTYINMDYVYDMNADSGNKSKAAAIAEKTSENAAAAIAADYGFEPVGKDFGTCYVEIVGAEAFVDSDGNDAVRFYYDFTNQERYIQSAWAALNPFAEQAGFDLSSAYASYGEEAAEDGNSSLEIYPGVTIRCIYECKYNPSVGGIVSFTLSDYDVELVAEFDAANLPGVVKEAPEIAPITEPNYTEGMATEIAGYDYYVSLTGVSEVVAGYEGKQILLVNMDFTNNSEEACSAWWKTAFVAYQDGIQLENDCPKGDSETYNNYYTDIEPGECINCSIGFVLRSDSPVEVFMADYVSYTNIGGVYSVATD